jgi:O-antigen ligase
MKRRDGQDGLLTYCFLASLGTITWEKLRWMPLGADVRLSELFALAFVGLFVEERLRQRDTRMARRAAYAAIFGAAFLLVYLCGFFNLETRQAFDQFAKGLGKFVLHFGFLVAGLAYVARRSERFYWRSLRWFFGGMAVNAAYGVVQLAAARAGFNLDASLLSPITHATREINVYGAIEGTKVYRPNALSVDPNHLAVMLVMPILVLVPVYVRLEKGHPQQRRLGALLAFLVLVEFATLSRSGFLGLVAGGLVLALPYHRRIASKTFLVPAGAVVLVVGVFALSQLTFFEAVIRSRIQSGRAGVHFAVYEFIPPVLHSHPLFGLGLNNFSVYYEFITGKSNWGPHSIYVAVFVESGLVGSVLFAAFIVYVFWCLGSARELGRRLRAAGDPVAVRVLPLAWGLTAGLVGTLAANAFYLTMTFFYFYAFLVFALAVPAVFGWRLARPPEAGPAVPPLPARTTDALPG